MEIEPTNDAETLPLRFCSDCKLKLGGMSIQPLWRHNLERINRKQTLETGINQLIHGYDTKVTPDSDESRVWRYLHFDPELNLEFSNLKYKADDDMFNSYVEELAHGYPETVSLRSERLYTAKELVCMRCWLHYRQSGARNPPVWSLLEKNKGQFVHGVNVFFTNFLNWGNTVDDDTPFKSLRIRTRQAIKEKVPIRSC